MLWGIDLGGTKVECVVLEDQSHKVLIRKRLPTESHKGYHHIIRQIKTLVELVSNELGEQPSSLGMGTPGSIDRQTGLMKNSNSTALNNQPFLKDISSTFSFPVRMANDANCFALAETLMGSVPAMYPDARVVFGVIMGTGVGGGLVFNGKAWDGQHGIGGEWGHNFLDESGGECYCGKVGCVERIISGPSLERYYRELTGVQQSLKEISASGTKEARQTIDRLIHFFGLGLSSVINIVDPDVIVVGGGVGNLQVIYDEGVQSVGNFVFNPHFSTPIIKPSLGDSAGVFGAALLVQ